MVLLCIAGCADAPAPAFEGYGTVSLGGAGGDSYHVTSLADAGPGSLRDGIVNRSGPRTIVFDVGGTITLSSDITIRTPFLTIAGETAPHPGITIRQATPFDTLVVAATHDIVISHLRFWGNWVAGGPDYENGKSITIDGDTNPDHVSQKIIFDHLTVRGAPDGGPDIWGEVRDVTISWCFFFKNYQTMTVSHTTAPYQVRQRISMHHNVLAKSGERNPQIRADVRDFDHVNNIAYDWGWAQGNGYGTRIRQVSGEPKVNGNFVNNAYIPGAVSPSWGLVYGSQPGRDSEDGGPTGPAPPQGTVIGGTNLGSLWVSGNILPAGNQDHYSTTAAPIPVPSYAQVTTWPAAQLGGRVLPSVGMKYRDAEEQAILDEIGRATAWSPAVVVTSPNGGETWPVGSERTVRWSAANLDPAAVVRISLSDGVTLTPIATVPRTQTSYPWTVPNSPTNDAAILVESLVGGSPETADMSDGVFSVTSSPAALDFFTLSPCRLVDTRGVFGPALAAASDRSFRLRGWCGIPPTAKALSVNLAVTSPSAVGHLRLYPAGEPLPNASALNYSAFQTRANNGVVPLSADGALTVRCVQGAGAAHFILDVNGFFQ